MRPMATSDGALIERYLEHVRVERRLAARSVELYAEHLKTLLAKAGTAKLALDRVQTAHVRRWTAQLHGAGREPRGIALVLSCWRGFYRWLGNEGAHRGQPRAGRACPQGSAPAAQGVGGGRRGAAGRTARRRRRPLGGKRATARSSSCSTAAACASANWSASTCRPARRRAAGSTSMRARPACSARAASGASCRSAPRRPRRWPPGSRCAANARRCRRPDCAIRPVRRRFSSAGTARAFRPSRSGRG